MKAKRLFVQLADPKYAKLAYLLLVLIAMALAGGAPSGNSGG